jgi:hypothetical protein
MNTRPTERDIELTRTGYYRLPCDGRHETVSHMYLYYTKREVIRLWKTEHPRKENA